MKQASNNGQSRGKLRLEKSEEISNTILENSQEDNDGIPMYSVENSELDDLLGEATTTKAETEQQEKTEQASDNKQKQASVSLREAMNLAVIGLGQITKVASDITGKDIVLGEIPTTIFAVLTAPLIQKYKPKMTIDPEDVDLDSWMPEMMAFGGVCAAGLPIWFQVKSEDTTEAVNYGDKSQPSA